MISNCLEHNLCSEHFFIPKHIILWETLLKRFKTGKPVDIIMIADILEDNNQLEKVGRTYLDRCVDSVVSIQYIDTYIETLQKCEKFRRARGLINKTSDMIDSKDFDADEILATIVNEALRELAPEKQSPEDYHLEHIERRNKAKTEGIVGLEVFTEGLKDLVGSWLPQDNVVIAGKSSNGKTDAMICEMLPQSWKNNVPIGIFETDMSEFLLRERMASHIAKVNTFRMRMPYWTQKEADDIDAAYEILNSLPIYINDNPDANINDIMFFGMICALKYDCKAFGMDFLQQIAMTKEEYKQNYRVVIGEHSKKIKSLGKRHDMTTFLLSQLSRYGEKTSDVTPALPNKEALKESGDIENNADIVILIGKEPDMPTEHFTFKYPVWDMGLNLDKARNGPTGVINLSYEPRYHRFMSRNQGDQRRTIIEIEKNR